MFFRVIIFGTTSLLWGCTTATEQTQQPAPVKSSKAPMEKPMDQPFMEHPSGDFKSAVDAIADAVQRLRALPEWDKWIAFRAQGMGGRVDSYHLASIRMKKGDIEFDKPIDIDIKALTERAVVPESCLTKTANGYSVASANPQQAARILDAIFRQHLGIRPHTGEGDDYAIGAEW